MSDRDEALLADFNRGDSGDVLAARFGISRQRVYQIIDRFRGAGRPVRFSRPNRLASASPEERAAWRAKSGRDRPHELEETVMAMRAAGYGPRATARCLAVSPNVIAGVIYRAEHRA